MINFDNDLAELNTELATKPSLRYVVVQRKLRVDGEVMQFRFYDADTHEKAREKMSMLLEDYRKGFNLVFVGDTKEMLMGTDHFEQPCSCGTYIIDIYDSCDYTDECAAGYVWQFGNRGTPVSCRGAKVESVSGDRSLE